MGILKITEGCVKRYFKRRKNDSLIKRLALDVYTVLYNI